MAAGRKGRDSREKILRAATKEFAQKGIDGARGDSIAESSGVNKNMIYHYFGSKEGLFIEVLERMYETVRDRQEDLSIRDLPPAEGIRKLIELTADVWIETPEFQMLLNSENLHKARHVKKSKKITNMYNPLMETIRVLLERGEKEGVFRSGIDPIDLYISITALSAYYVSRRHTFEAIFKTKLMTADRIQKRKDSISETILRYLATA